MRYLILLILLSLSVKCLADSDAYFVQSSFSQSVSSAVASSSVSTITAHGPLKYYALQVSGVGAAPSAWDVRLEGSLDGLKYVSLAQNATGDGDGSVKVATKTAVSPMTYVRAYVKSLSLGSASSIKVTALATQ